jgi:hypothetical protein
VGSDLVLCMVNADSILDESAPEAYWLIGLWRRAADIFWGSVLLLVSSSNRYSLRGGNIFVILSHGLHDHVLQRSRAERHS